MNSIDIINFTSHELYLFVSFMCGLLLGYIIGKREGGNL
jgi:hypothetical protein